MRMFILERLKRRGSAESHWESERKSHLQSNGIHKEAPLLLCVVHWEQNIPVLGLEKKKSRAVVCVDVCNG